MKIENPLPSAALGAGLGVTAFAFIKSAELAGIFTVAAATTAIMAALPVAFWGAMVGLATWGVGTLFKGVNAPAPAPKAA